MARVILGSPKVTGLQISHLLANCQGKDPHSVVRWRQPPLWPHVLASPAPSLRLRNATI